jgi:putative flippase GtrA
MTIKRTKTRPPAARVKRRLRPAAPKVARARSSDAGEIIRVPLELFSRAPKFIIVGLAATLVHFLTLSCLVEIARMPWPTVASAIGSVAGIATSYYGNYAWTFIRTEPHRTFLGHFITVYVFTMSVNTLLLYLQITFLQFDYVVAFLVATIFSTLMNFLLVKFAVFEREGFAPLPPGREGCND